LPRHGAGFVVGLHIDERIAANNFLGLGEWSIRHVQLATAGADSKPFCGALESGRVLEKAALEPFGDELTHSVQQTLGDGLGAMTFGMSDEHQVFHDRVSMVNGKALSFLALRDMDGFPWRVVVRDLHPHVD
jgi:hypothetical protein